MVLKGLIKRLEYKLRGGLASFVLQDGSTYYFSAEHGEVFLHSAECIRADHAGRPRPEPPPTLVALCKARDRRAALEKVAREPGGLFPYDTEALLERGELVPRSIVAES